MNLLTSLRTLALALVLSIGISYAYAAWAPPLATPTGGNTDAPVNVGNATQVKGGGLGVTGLLEVGIPSGAGSLLFKTYGNVGADKYCDRGGNNCIDAGVGAGGIQKRVTGTCSGGTFLVGVNSDGTVNCAAASGGTQFYQCPNIQPTTGSASDGTLSYCPTNCNGQVSTGSTCSYQESNVQSPCINTNNQWQTASCTPI